MLRTIVADKNGAVELTLCKCCCEMLNAVNEFNSTAFKLFELFTRSSATAETAILRVGGHYVVHSHSRSPVLVTIESPLCDLLQYNNTIQYKTCNVLYVTRMLFVGAGMTRDCVA